MSEGAQSTVCCCPPGGDDGGGQVGWCPDWLACMPPSVTVNYTSIIEFITTFPDGTAQRSINTYTASGTLTRKDNGDVLTRRMDGMLSVSAYSIADDAAVTRCGGYAFQYDPPNQCGCQPCTGELCRWAIPSTTEVTTDSPAQIYCRINCVGATPGSPAKMVLTASCGIGPSCINGVTQIRIIPGWCNFDSPTTALGDLVPVGFSREAPLRCLPGVWANPADIIDTYTEPAGIMEAICYLGIPPNEWQIVGYRQQDCGSISYYSRFSESLTVG